MKRILTLVLVLTAFTAQAQYPYRIALLKYGGGGDWYANIETSLPNLITFCNQELGTQIDPQQAVVEVGDRTLFNYPFAHMTGHGNVIFSDREAQHLRKYLTSGGFLHIDDNYGMDRFIRPEMKKVFPELEFIELPASHPIFHQQFEFSDGLPKIHAHDDARPQALALIYEGRMVCLYTYESDLGDGWEDPRIHNDTRENHVKALQMGANIIQYVFMNGRSAG